MSISKILICLQRGDVITPQEALEEITIRFSTNISNDEFLNLLKGIRNKELSISDFVTKVNFAPKIRREPCLC